jgi:exodeoxyribonuclease V gamma subunit
MSTNPLLSLAGALVAVAGGRGTASEVLDLVTAAPVRHRWGFDDDEVATIIRWVERSGIRWGLNEALREPFRLDGFPQNTWRAGLDRVLLGVAMAEEPGCQLGGTLPLDDVGSAAVDLAGRLAELVARLESVVHRLRRATTLADWTGTLRSGVLQLGSVAQPESWQVAQFERELDGILDGARQRDPQLRLADVRTLLEQRLQPRPTRANFRTGNLTVCTMVPMRSVPHRVVCLVGLDDGVFPRSTASDGDDVLARGPMTGERDPRSEDRQLLLDAVLATRETLVVTYTGANEHSGQERPPAVPLGELLDSIERTVPGARDRVLVRHPLQPFDPQSFVGGALGRPEPFSFDRAALSGSRAALGSRSPRPPLLTAPLPRWEPADLTLAELQSFYANPVRGFLRQRLDVGVPQEYDEIDDALPVELDALREWTVGDRILRRAVAGDDPTGVCLAELLRGDLPPLQLGERVLERIVKRVDAIFGSTASARGLPPHSIDVTVDLGAGRRLTGVVPDVRGNRIVRVHYSNLGPKHRFASWLDLLALTAGHQDQSWTASTYGWHRVNSTQHSLLGPLDHTALDHVKALVDIYDRGLRQPLPLPVKTAHAWADAIRAHRAPEQAALRQWETSDGSPVPGEQEDPAHVRVFGRNAPFRVLTEPPRSDEQWSDQRTRLGQYSLRMWQPVFDHEQVMSA